MADTKTSQLPQLAATPDVADLLMLVDVSDTTMAATGTNKRVTASYLARSDAGAKLITGNGLELTVPATGTAGIATSGSWTPELRFGGATTGITYSTRTGTWKRTGDLIIANFAFVLTSKGSATGAASLAGLPVNMTGSIAWRYINNMAATANILIGYVTATNVLTLVKVSSGSSVALTDTDFNNNSYLEGQLVAYA